MEAMAVQYKSEIETQGEDDTLMGRLAKRMASRDFIDRFDLGTSGAKVKKAAIADMGEIPQKINLGSYAADLVRGSEIEKEHTDNPKEAEKIAKDHLNEHKKYYDKKVGLPAMEDKLKKRKV